MNRLALEVRQAGGHFDDTEYELVIRVDGVPVLGEAWGGIGRDPDALLGEFSELLPGEDARDVTLQRCGCGVEGCGSLVARIRRVGDGVVWDDFRLGGDQEAHPSVASLGEFRFDFAAYEAEVRRAHRNRAWETPGRRTARLLRERIEGVVLPGGWTIEWAADRVHDYRRGTAEPGVTVSLRREGEQLVLGFRGLVTTSDVRAVELAAVLQGEDPAAWPVIFRGGIA